MRSNKYAISRLKDTVTFGDYENTGKINPNTGKKIKGFVGRFTVHCGTYSMTIGQQISLAGALTTNTLLLVIRHNKDVQQYKEAKYKGNTYRVTNISVDESLNAYDVVTLSKKEGFEER